MEWAINGKYLISNYREGLGKFKQNLSQLRSTSQEVIAEDFAELDAIQWEPIEWHSLLHQLESVDARIKKITLPTCSVLRMVNNDFLADVLYYFTSYHGQQIIDIVANSMNESYTKFMKQYPDFKGKIAIYAHSLGGIISYDILANQSRTRRNTSRPAHHNVIYPSLKFQPEYLFAIGSPIAAVLVMRGQNFDDYKIMPGTRYFNIFHLYDPIAYRVEPLMGERYEGLNPILLQRPSSRNRPTFSYYTEQFASYMASTSFKTQLSDISLKLPSLPNISLPNIPGLELAKETLNKQFSIMIDSITNYSAIFGSINSSPKSLKRKREEEDEAAQEEGHASSSQYRVIKQPVSLKYQNLHKSEEKETIEIDSTESIITHGSTSQTSILNVAYSTVMQQTVSTVLNRIVTPVMEKIPSISNRSTPTKDLEETGESTLHRDLNGFSKICPEIMDKRFDYYIQESLIDNNVHQYLLGLRSHFSYWWNKEIHYFIIKNLETD
jgi:hypothetical protein